MTSSMTHFNEGVLVLLNSLLCVLALLIFAWWLSRRPPAPPQPKKPRYSQRLQEQFRRGEKKRSDTSSSDQGHVDPQAERTTRDRRRKVRRS